MMLAAEGVALTLLARNPERLEAAAADIRARFGVPVTAVAGDVTRAQSDLGRSGAWTESRLAQPHAKPLAGEQA